MENKKQKTKQKTGETLTNVCRNLRTFAAKNTRMSFCIVYLASPRRFIINTNTGPVPRSRALQVSYTIVRKHFPTTDVFIFHEDYTEEDKLLFPGVKEFIQVDFSGFDSVFNPSFGRSKGYLLMCRFFTGQLQKTPQLQNYSHYMRLDDDSYLMEPFLTEEKVKQTMLTSQYVYRSYFHEADSQQTLFQFTLYFLKKIYGVSFLTMNILRSKLEAEKVTVNGIYTGIAPYNNFHICPLDLWRLPIVTQYLEAIEREHGFLRYAWLDANVHAMILYVLSKVDTRITHILNTTFGYRHNHHVVQVNQTVAMCDPSVPFFPDVDM